MDDVIGFIDGLSLTSGCISDVLEKNCMYSGYHSDTMVDNNTANGWTVRYFFVPSTFQVAGMMGQ